jgi:hypothetical protein
MRVGGEVSNADGDGMSETTLGFLFYFLGATWLLLSAGTFLLRLVKIVDQKAIKDQLTLTWNTKERSRRIASQAVLLVVGPVFFFPIFYPLIAMISAILILGLV